MQRKCRHGVSAVQFIITVTIEGHNVRANTTNNKPSGTAKTILGTFNYFTETLRNWTTDAPSCKFTKHTV